MEEEYVDLGLPSGNLWAKNNYHATPNNPRGEYYAFHQVRDLEKNLEDGCNIPSNDDFWELIIFCKWEVIRDYRNQFDSYVIIGRNGNKIYLVATGTYYGVSSRIDILSGYYWSITCYDHWSACYLKFNARSIDVWRLDFNYRQPVRLIKKKSI